MTSLRQPQSATIQERSRIWHHRQLDLNLFQARQSRHTYPRHIGVTPGQYARQVAH